MLVLSDAGMFDGQTVAFAFLASYVQCSTVSDEPLFPIYLWLFLFNIAVNCILKIDFQSVSEVDINVL